jgi:hypothetical protein
MADDVSELLIPQTALDKLGARRISEEAARQLLGNRSLVVPNPWSPHAKGRRLLLGTDDGGRALTLVIEPTMDPTTWVVVTGWEAGSEERKVMRRDER